MYSENLVAIEPASGMVHLAPDPIVAAASAVAFAACPDPDSNFAEKVDSIPIGPFVAGRYLVQVSSNQIARPAHPSAFVAAFAASAAACFDPVSSILIGRVVHPVTAADLVEPNQTDRRHRQESNLDQHLQRLQPEYWLAVASRIAQPEPDSTDCSQSLMKALRKEADRKRT